MTISSPPSDTSNPPASAPEDTRAEPCHAQHLLDAARAVLHQGSDLLGHISAETYRRKVPSVFNGSIGGHYRHCLDHFTSLLQGIAERHVDYDCRARDPRLESDPAYALQVTGRILDQLTALPLAQWRATVSVRSAVHYGSGDSPRSESTLARELSYAIAHSLHHYALIAVMAGLLAIDLPEHFGMAPSTVKHRNASSTH